MEHGRDERIQYSRREEDERQEDDKHQYHANRHEILPHCVAPAQAEDDAETVLDDDEEPRAQEDAAREAEKQRRPSGAS